MTKIEVISQNLQKTGFLAKNDHLGEDFRKFSAKTNDKSYKSKTLKKLDFCQKWQFFNILWPKNPQF